VPELVGYSFSLEAEVVSEMLLLDVAEGSVRSLWQVFQSLNKFVWQFEDAWIAVFHLWLFSPFNWFLRFILVFIVI
jgi:hypothetical protein